MRSIGAAQYALDTMLKRVTDPSRKTFGKFLYEHGLSNGLRPKDKFLPFVLPYQELSYPILRSLVRRLKVLAC